MKNEKPQDFYSAVFLIQLNLIQIEFHSGVISGEKIDFIDLVEFVIVKYLDVFVLEQIQVHLVAVVAYTHDKGAFCVEQIYFFC